MLRCANSVEGSVRLPNFLAPHQRFAWLAGAPPRSTGPLLLQTHSGSRL